MRLKRGWTWWAAWRTAWRVDGGGQALMLLGRVCLCRVCAWCCVVLCGMVEEEGLWRRDGRLDLCKPPDFFPCTVLGRGFICLLFSFSLGKLATWCLLVRPLCKERSPRAKLHCSITSPLFLGPCLSLSSLFLDPSRSQAAGKDLYLLVIPSAAAAARRCKNSSSSNSKPQCSSTT
jgi:hypothetical protein